MLPAPAGPGSRVAWFLSCETGIREFCIKDDPVVSSPRGPPEGQGICTWRKGREGLEHWTGVPRPPTAPAASWL